MAIKKRSFVFGVSVNEENFIGRQAETHTLINNFEEGINTIIISPRRWGKTSLVNHVRRHINREYVLPVYVDIFGCKNEYELYNALIEALLKQTATQMQLWMENAKDFLSRLTPKISVSTDPNAEISLSLGITPKTHKPEEILELAENIAIQKNVRIVICIDEFQQIGEFPDSISIQKRLRGIWQHQHHVSYCLFGSKKHMMSNIFQDKSMPFYQFGQILFLPKIPTSEWAKYITTRFEENSKHISDIHAQRICNEVNGYSSYVQQLAWHVFALLNEGETVTDEHIDSAMTLMMESCEFLFLQQIERLTEYQMNFLRAICHGITKNFGEEETRTAYQLGSPANITRLKSALTKYDIIESDGFNMSFTDPIFARWFKQRFCK